MKKTMITLCLVAFTSGSAPAAVYQWTDADGVTNFTDKRESIPKTYRGKAVRRETDGNEPPPAAAAPAPRPTSPPAPPAPGAVRYGGKPAAWWAGQFRALRGQTKVVKGELSDKESQLAILKRKRAIYMRTRDRVAVNTMQEAIDRQTAQLEELKRQLEALERSADEAGVPAAARQ